MDDTGIEGNESGIQCAIEGAEEWRFVVGYEGFYEISNKGNLRALERKGIYQGRWNSKSKMTFRARDMKICSTPTGYQYAAIKRPNEKSVKHLIHRLVMQAFIGSPSADRFQVNHKNGIKADNRLENLEYCSASENLLHLTHVLKRKIGGAGGRSKLTKEQAISILSDNRALKEIGADYGITLQAVWLLKNKKNWKHLHRELDDQAKTKELKANQ